MSFTHIPATIGGNPQNLLATTDSSGNLATAHVLVSGNGAEVGTASAPLSVAIVAYPEIIINNDAGENIATGQVTVGNTATLICAARDGRTAVTVVNESDTLVRIGPSTVTLNNGAPLPGALYTSINIEGGAAVYGIVASSTTSVSFIEVF